MKRQVATIVGWLAAVTLWAQPVCDVTKYDEADGVSSAHITQLLQDEQGFMWFATWNGLCRYDGYDFQTFKPQVGDGCHMTTDRIRNINLLPKGRILCQVDEDYYLFDLSDYRFRDLNADERQHASAYRQQYRQSRSLMKGTPNTAIPYADVCCTRQPRQPLGHRLWQHLSLFYQPATHATAGHRAQRRGEVPVCRQ